MLEEILEDHFYMSEATDNLPANCRGCTVFNDQEQ